MKRFLILALLISTFPAAWGSDPLQETTFTLSSDAETPVIAHVRFPEMKANERVPALLIFGGFVGGARVLEPLHPTCPMALATFDYPYSGNRKIKFPQVLRDGPEMKRAVHAVTPLIAELLGHLRKHPRIDGNQIAILGASFGAPFALAAAARPDLDIRRIVLIQAMGDAQGTIQSRLELGLKKRLLRNDRLRNLIAKAGAWMIWKYLSLPEPENDAIRLRSDQSLLWIDSPDDEVVSDSAKESLLTALSRSRAKIERVSMGHGHLAGIQDPAIRDMENKTEKWLERSGFFDQTGRRCFHRR